ncbi:MAG: glutamate 5-kinase [Anaerolineales bacterium]|nr:glutamate 5-kinase [Anaerolineales bacterium]
MELQNYAVEYDISCQQVSSPQMSQYQRIVIKIGTSVLTGGTPNLDRPHMMHLVGQCAELYHQGHEIILVSSGAIAAGRQRLSIDNLPDTVSVKQMLAAVGQTRLMQVWEQFFDIYDIHVGQILLTRGDVESRSRYLNARDTLEALLEHGVVPIINENDAVGTEEIRLGDNDNLSALVTLLSDADLLVMLTDQPGLFTADPRLDPNAKLIPEVNDIDKITNLQVGNTRTGLGTGGMITKLKAANYACRAGADVVIAAGITHNVISQIAAGESVGTRFPAMATPLESRKRWILAGSTPTGALTIDDGAVRALEQSGRSLLPAGIQSIEGGFRRGDTVRIQSPEQKELARGIVRYSSKDLALIKGRQSDEIAEILGYFYGAVAVHRNDLILL